MVSGNDDDGIPGNVRVAREANRRFRDCVTRAAEIVEATTDGSDAGLERAARRALDDGGEANPSRELVRSVMATVRKLLCGPY